MKIRRTLVAAIAVAAFSAVSANADLFETEPNNSFGTASEIIRGDANWSDVGVMNLMDGGGDLDFFSIHLNAGEIITIITTPMEEPFEDPDTMLGFFDNGGTMLDFNDDANGLGSAIRYLIEETGNYFIGVTGWPDEGFTGDHSEDGDYALTVSIVEIPAPAAGALLVVAGLVTRRRRRQ